MTEESRPYTQLTVNLSDSVADVLRNHMDIYGVGLTESVRQAIGALHLHDSARANGYRLMVVDGQGEDAIFREIEWPS